MIARVQAKMDGVIGMLGFREDWRRAFDVSPDAFWGSFMAAAWGLPFFIISILVQSELITDIADQSGETPPTVGLFYVVVLYALMWGYFPVIAKIFTDVVGLREGFMPWVIF